MKHLATILLLALCATAPAQTIKTLGYNTTNGEVVAATNITFTNGVAFTTNAAAATLANLGLGTNASVTISNLNAQSVNITNAAAFRTNIGLGATNTPTFEGINISDGDDLLISGSAIVASSYQTEIQIEEAALKLNDVPIIQWSSGYVAINNTLRLSATNAAPTNTNAPAPDAWVDIEVGTNTYKLPLWQ